MSVRRQPAPRVRHSTVIITVLLALLAVLCLAISSATADADADESTTETTGDSFENRFGGVGGLGDDEEIARVYERSAGDTLRRQKMREEAEAEAELEDEPLGECGSVVPVRRARKLRITSYGTLIRFWRADDADECGYMSPQDTSRYFQSMVTRLRESNFLEVLELEEKVDLSLRSATELGLNLYAFPHLKQLIIKGRNSLTYESAEALFKFAADIDGLEKLVIGTNPLNAMGAGIIASALTKFDHLKHLEICGTDMKQQGAKLIAKALRFLPELETLILNDNQFDWYGVTFVAERIHYLKNLRVLELARNGMKDEGMRNLSHHLHEVPNLRRLVLGPYNEIEEEGAADLAKVLHDLKQLEELDLQQNTISDVGVEVIAEALVDVPSLRSINVYKNEITTRGLKVLIHELRNHDMLTINVGENRNGLASMKELAEHVGNWKNLENLLMRYIQGAESRTMPDEFWDAISTVLANISPSIKKLDLAYFDLQDDNVKTLVEQFERWTNLQYLELQANKLNVNYRGKMILDNVHKLVALDNLSMQDCYMTDEQTENVRNLENFPKTLRRMDFYGNRFTGVTFIPMSASFDKLPKLEVVDWGSNNMGRQSMIEVYQNTKRHLAGAGKGVLKNMSVLEQFGLDESTKMQLVDWRDHDDEFAGVTYRIAAAQYSEYKDAN